VKGRQILIEPLPAGGNAAALIVDGKLQDLLIDADPSDPAPSPEAIFRAVAGRPLKGAGGAIVDLGDGLSGFLRGAQLPAPGRPLLVQVSGWAEPGKAAPVTERLLLKGRTAILTPGSPGRNIARSLSDPTLRDSLAAAAEAAMAGADPGLGVILRSAAATVPPEEITAEIATLRAAWDEVSRKASGAPGLVRSAPGAAAEARREWTGPGAGLVEGPGALAERGVWEEVEMLRGPEVRLGDGWMAIEPTRALTAIDVNTGADTSAAAALKVNIAAAKELPRQLRLRGLGGQVVIDFAPLARKDRARIESALAAALRVDVVETAVLGWTPLGHLELRRKRARRRLV
jgi:Ribonuclease G/E